MHWQVGSLPLRHCRVLGNSSFTMRFNELMFMSIISECTNECSKEKKLVSTEEQNLSLKNILMIQSYP